MNFLLRLRWSQFDNGCVYVSTVTVTQSQITLRQLVETFGLICFATELFLCDYLAEVNKNERKIWIIATALSLNSAEVPIGKKGFQVVVDIRLPDDLAKIEYVLFFSNVLAAGHCSQWYICEV